MTGKAARRPVSRLRRRQRWTTCGRRSVSHGLTGHVVVGERFPLGRKHHRGRCHDDSVHPIAPRQQQPLIGNLAGTSGRLFDGGIHDIEAWLAGVDDAAVLGDDPGAVFPVGLILERSEERRVGTAWVSRCRFGWSQYPKKKKNTRY